MRGLAVKAWRDVIGRPARSLMTILAVAIGVGGAVAIVSTSYNLARAQRLTYASTNRADIQVWLWDAPDALVPLLDSDPRVAAAELRYSQLTKWRSDGRWSDIELVGLADPAAPRVDQFEQLAGVAPGMGELAIDQSGANREDVHLGETVAVRDALGRSRSLQISGITRSPARLSASITRIDVAYVPREWLRRAFDLPGSNQLLVRLHDPDDAPAFVRRLEMILRRQRIPYAAPEVRSAGEYAGKRELDALVLVMVLFGGLGGVLASLLVANTMAATVAEQTREIAIIKALGGREHQVVALYTFEALVYGLAGTLLGVGLGLAGGWLLLRWIASLGNASVTFTLSPESLAAGLGAGLLIAAISGYLPARRAVRLTVAGTLESLGIVSDFGASPVERLVARLRLPGLLAMAVRELARRKLRTALTLGVIALASGAFMGADSTRSTVAQAIEQIYRTYYADGWAWLGQGLGPEAIGSMTAQEGVYAAEAWAIADGVVGLAPARLWGLPADSTLYREVLANGRWLRPGEHDVVVLSPELAAHQGLWVGDTVELQVGKQGRRFTVVGIAVDNTIFLGGSLAGKAFVAREDLARLMGQPERYTLVALGLSDRSPAMVDEILGRLERHYSGLGLVPQAAYVEIEAAQEASRLLTLALMAMLALVALMGALGMLNTLALNVIERRREIAVLRVLGATDGAIVLLYTAQGLLLAAGGWCLGLLLSGPIAWLLTRQLERVLFTLPAELSLRAVLLSAVAALALGCVASLAPALGAARFAVSESLRYE